MNVRRSFEERLLRDAKSLLDSICDGIGKNAVEARFQVLEAVSSRLGGFSLDEYFEAFYITPCASHQKLLGAARDLVTCIERTKIPTCLALCALAREALSPTDQRTSGAYHTDFRLALHLADRLAPWLRSGTRMIDPACGAGMLLTAVSFKYCGMDRELAREWLSKSVYAVDMSPAALRGTLLSLASLTDDIGTLKRMRHKWRVQDSLLATKSSWKELAREGFEVVIANPPWEKVKLTRHEYISSKGEDRHYGSQYNQFDFFEYSQKQAAVADYGKALAANYQTLKNGEPDLYAAFTELFLNLLKSDGVAGLLLPAGLIRSQGTEALRQVILSKTKLCSFTVIENRANFFPIDTRFKFLSALLQFGDAKSGVIEIRHGQGSDSGVFLSPPLTLSQKALRKLRPDLTIPEVRNKGELRVFRQIQEKGEDWSDSSSPWFPDFMRELDMTRDRRHFVTARSKGAPIIEGRMIQHHRFGAKGYSSGSGRRAIWESFSPGQSRVAPQFRWPTIAPVAERVGARSRELRAGFCDITGQTNERSLMAAMIPPGAICGNKVPTVQFPNDPSAERLLVWLAIVNSFAFDWALRRIITTTVNYFLLTSVALPPLQPTSLPGRQLADISRKLNALDTAGSSLDILWKIAELRAKADVLVLSAYGLKSQDLKLIMRDFPLLDRSQPPLRGESRSTITHDLLTLRFKERGKEPTEPWSSRVAEAKRLGAVAYLASAMPGAEALDQSSEEESA